MSALFVTWRGGDTDHGVWGPVGRLDYADGLYRFVYTKGARSLEAFTPFPQMTDFNQIYESEKLFPLFANRLLSPSRAEYDAFLRWGGFSPDEQPDPIAILGVTEGIRQTDSIEVFPCPRPDASGNYVNKFFLRGLRSLKPAALERAGRLLEGELLHICPDPDNDFDPHAVALKTADLIKVGYVPRYLADDAAKLLSNDRASAQVNVERVNADASLQQRVLCRMWARWPDGFMPCQGEEFEPIPNMDRIPVYPASSASTSLQAS